MRKKVISVVKSGVQYILSHVIWRWDWIQNKQMIALQHPSVHFQNSPLKDVQVYLIIFLLTSIGGSIIHQYCRWWCKPSIRLIQFLPIGCWRSPTIDSQYPICWYNHAHEFLYLSIIFVNWSLLPVYISIKKKIENIYKINAFSLHTFC